MSRPDILKRIIEKKQTEVDALKRKFDIDRLKEQMQRPFEKRSFLDALKITVSDTGHVALIAEIKKASPSSGVIREDFEPATLAKQYLQGGATCLSVLTDEPYFQGRLEYLKAVHGAVHLPLLRKDFIIDRIQLFESWAAGADAILLIAACLDPAHLHDLHREATSIGMDVLVEVHNEEELDGVLSAGPIPPIIGINNRNLHDFTVDLGTTKRLAPALNEKGVMVVAESGIYTSTQVEELKAAGASAILVGESLMREPDVEAATLRLLFRESNLS